MCSINTDAKNHILTCLKES